MTRRTDGRLDPRRRAVDLRGLLRQHTFAFSLVLVVVLAVANIAIQPSINWTSQFASFAPLGVAAMASTPSIVSGRGGIDMSTSPVMTLAAIVFVSMLVPAGLGGIVALPLTMLLGASIGAVIGLIIVVFRISPIVVTLAAYFIVTGVNLKIAPRPVLMSGENWITSFAGSFGPIPAALFSLAVPLCIWFGLTATAFGRNLYAVGGDDATAYSAGVNVAAVRVVTFAVGGSFSAFGGLVLVALVRTADSSTSGAYTLIAIAGAALGGVSLAGGRGTPFGALLGAAAIFLLQSVLADLRMPSTWLPMVYGALLIVSVVIGSAVLGQNRQARS